MAENIDAEREAVARAICVACGEVPDHKGDARGNAFRWQDYLDVADAAIAARRTPSASIGEDGLPELPKMGDMGETRINRVVHLHYSDAQMRQYAREAVAADCRARVNAPVPRWVDNEKGKDPVMDDMIGYIADLRAQLARQSQGEPVYQYRQKRDGCTWIECDANTQHIMRCSPAATVFEFRTLYAAPPLSSEQQAEKGQTNV